MKLNILKEYYIYYKLKLDLFILFDDKIYLFN